MRAFEQLRAIEERGCRMAQFCAGARERGGIAETDEGEDLPVLHALCTIARPAARARAR